VFTPSGAGTASACGKTTPRSTGWAPAATSSCVADEQRSRRTVCSRSPRAGTSTAGSSTAGRGH